MTDKQYSVRAPARLHLGFLDSQRDSGRRFGGLGLCISDLATHLTVKRSLDVAVNGRSDDLRSVAVSRLLAHLGIDGGVDMTIHEATPAHAGLGSGTQFSLAMGVAISRLYGLQISIPEIASLTERGARSGIGIGAFSKGGFLVDGGRGDGTVVPPITSRYDFPEAWRVLLVLDDSINGVNGHTERVIFEQLPPWDEALSGRICYLVLMGVLPALAERDCAGFGAAITEIQNLMGEYFSEAQNGCYASQRVAKVMAWLLEEGGAMGVGQSSWGPTGFAIYADADVAEQAMLATTKRWAHQSGLKFCVCQGRNTGADEGWES